MWQSSFPHFSTIFLYFPSFTILLSNWFWNCNRLYHLFTLFYHSIESIRLLLQKVQMCISILPYLHGFSHRHSHKPLNYYFIFTKLNSNRNFRKQMQIPYKCLPLTTDHCTPFYILQIRKTMKLLVYDCIACMFLIGFSHIYFFVFSPILHLNFVLILCVECWASFSSIECDIKPTETSCSSSEIKTWAGYIDIKLVRDYKA